MRFSIILLFTLFCVNSNSQTFNLDQTFAPNVGGSNLGFGPNGVIYTSALQLDGKIIIAGNFTSYDGIQRKTIARLLTNGNIDTTFISAFESFNAINNIEVQSDGKIIVTGNLYELGSVNLPSNSKAITRLNPDGSKDLTFSQVLPSNYFSGCKILTNGKIIVFGPFTYINGNGNPYNKIARLNSDGTLDLTFYQGTGGNYSVLDVIELSNQKIVAVGDFTQFDGNYYSGIVRLNPSGSVDVSFVSPGTNLFNENRFKSVKLQSDGKFVVAGRVITTLGIYQNVYRFNTDGTLDLSFYSNGTYYQQIEDCAIQSDDKIILSGTINGYDGHTVKHIFRLNANGNFDNGFLGSLKFDAQVDDIHVISGDTLIVTGYFSKYGSKRKMRISKLDPNGNSMDNFPNVEGFDLPVNELKIQPDDKVLAVGDFSNFENNPSNGICRLTQNGEYDPTFFVGDGANDAISTLLLQADGKIIIGGKFTLYDSLTANYLVRLNSDGTLDNTLSVTVDNEITKIYLQDDGKFILTGNFTIVNGVSRKRIARMLPDWTLDLTFNPGTGFNGIIEQIDVNSLGKILVSGTFSSFNGSSTPYIAMLNPDGSLDPQFDITMNYSPEYIQFHTDTSWFITSGYTILQTYGYNSILPYVFNFEQQMTFVKITHIIQLPDSRYILHGLFQYIDELGNNQSMSIIRTDSLFNMETGFESNYFGEIYTSAFQSNGKLVCGGDFSGIQFNIKNKIARVVTCPEYIIEHIFTCTPYTWTDGNTYNSATNSPVQYLTNDQGCDSVAYLNLEFYPTYDTTISFLNYTSSYTWPLNGQTYTQTGIYDHTLQTINGCDSIIHLNLLFVPSPESTEILNNWVANGDIYDIDYDSLNNRMILGGNFTGFSRKGSGPKLLDESTGFPTDFVPTHDGFITQVTSDGSNGYFVIGGFTIIGDSLRDNIAHLDSNYNVTAWHADGPANFTEIIIGGNYLFGRTFNDVKALDITTGNVLSWTVSAYGGDNIYTMEYIDGYLYIGGDFTLLIAPTLIPKKALAQIDPTTGVPTSWNPFSTGTPSVYDIHADGNKLYFGGTFGFFSGWTRNRIARATVTGSSLTVDTWNPNANADVYSIQTSSTKVLILGAFTTIAGSSRQGVAYINKANTTLHSFNPGTGLSSSLYYTAAKFLNGNLYIQFGDPDVTIGSSKRSYLASFDTINFQLRSWVVNPNANAEIEVANGKLIVCGPYNFIGFIEKPLIAAVDPNTLDILNWNTTVAGTVVTKITIAGNKLFVSGNIIYNSGSYYEGIQVFNLSTGLSIATPEQINGSNGQLLDYNNGFVYASRYYGDITSPPNWSFCRIDTSSLNFDMTFDLAIAWTSNPSYESVLDCEFVDSLMYFSGDFDIVQGQTRSGVASINLNTLQITPFSISIPGFNIYIELFEDNIIILGPYDTINSQPRSYLSSVNRFNGNLSSWYPNFNQPPYSFYSINSLEIKDNFIYVGGDYNYGSQIQRYGLASFSLNSNYPASITFSQFSVVNDLCFSNNRLHAVGDLLSPSNVSLIEKHKVFDICNLEIDEYDTTFNSTNYTWNGILCQQSGLYFYSVNNPTGCDSNYILHLTILPAIEVNQTLVKCNSYAWTINGQTYTTTGVYYDTVYNINLADTNFTLNLTIVNEYLTNETQTICDSYLWPINNTTYSNSGVYVDTILSTDGCDSIVSLDLTILPNLPITVNTFSLPSDDVTCVGELAVNTSGNNDFILDIDNGMIVNTSSGYDVFQNLCIGVHSLKITDFCGDTLSVPFVIPVDSNYIFNNPYIDSMAVDSLGITISNCTIYYNSIDTAYIDSVFTVGNSVTVIWNIIDSNGSNYDTSTYILNNGNGVYYLQLSIFCPTKALGEYFTVTEAYYFQMGYASTEPIPDDDLSYFNVFPNPTSETVKIVFSETNGQLAIFDMQGKLLLNAAILNEQLISLKSLQSGIYFFELTSSNGKTIKRVVKN